MLLVEVMRADPEIKASEREAMMTGLREKFTLTETELADLVKQAEQQSKSAYDYHQFTSLINDHCTQPQKIRIIESMWQVAYSDAHVNADENHIISRIAGLLYVTHGDYIAAKMYAKETAAKA